MDHRDPENYRFDDYLDALGDDWYGDDEILRRWVERSSLTDEVANLVREFGKRSATLYREIADVVERKENLPYLGEMDAYNQRRADVVLPAETWRVLADVHGSGIWKASMDERARYAIVYLLNQNGEFGVTCSTACTDGMRRALLAFGDDPRSQEVLHLLEHATPDQWIHGAQFVTEIQGGSDAATNALRAEPAADGLYHLSGQKWFCSNITADYWMLTARANPADPTHRGVGMFCVPREWEDAPNGWTITRLKDKLGTRALPTAEVDFVDTVGWPVGPLDAGLKNMVAIVLTSSRIHNTLGAAAGGRRSTREALAYANFRQAFGKKLADHPLLANTLKTLVETADLTEAGAFATVDAWVDAMTNPDDLGKKLWARILISLAKAVTARRAYAHSYDAMMIFGGNGIEERFCAMPRLWRDAAILETWEGSYTLLLMQALGDLAKFGVAGREEDFLRYALGEHLHAEHVEEMAAVLAAPDEEENILRWGELAPQLYRSFEERALAGLSG